MSMGIEFQKPEIRYQVKNKKSEFPEYAGYIKEVMQEVFATLGLDRVKNILLIETPVLDEETLEVMRVKAQRHQDYNLILVTRNRLVNKLHIHEAGFGVIDLADVKSEKDLEEVVNPQIFDLTEGFINKKPAA